MKPIVIIFIFVFLAFIGIILGDVFSNTGDNESAKIIGETIKLLGDDALWNPFFFAGMPMIAFTNMHFNASFTQPIVQLLFSWSPDGWLLAYFLLASIATYYLARRLGIGEWASLVPALIYAFNPMAISIAVAGHGGKLMTLAWIPVQLFFLFRLLERPNLLNTGLLGLALGTMLLSRHPQMAFYGMLLSLGVLVYNYTTLRKKVVWIYLCSAFVISILMFASAYFPLAEYAKHSARSLISGGLPYDYATMWSYPPLETLTYLWPWAYGFGGASYHGGMPFTDAPAYLGFVAILGIVLAIKNRNGLVYFLLALSAIMIYLSWGKFSLLYDMMFYTVPHFNQFRAPSMILLAAALPLGLLAGIGIDRLKWKHWAVGLLAIDLFLFSKILIKPVKNDVITLPQTIEQGRVWPENLNINSYARYGLQTIGGYSPVKLGRYQEYLESSPSPNTVIKMLNVRLAIQKDTLFQVSNGLPHAWYVDSLEYIREKRDILKRIGAPNFDPYRVAVVEDIPPIVSRERGPIALEWSPNRIVFKTNKPRPTFVVISEIYYPQWKARVDGIETKMYATDYILRGVVVPGGEHIVDLYYEQEAEWSTVVSIAGWGIGLLMVFLGWRKR